MNTTLKQRLADTVLYFQTKGKNFRKFGLVESPTDNAPYDLFVSADWLDNDPEAQKNFIKILYNNLLEEKLQIDTILFLLPDDMFFITYPSGYHDFTQPKHITTYDKMLNRNIDSYLFYSGGTSS